MKVHVVQKGETMWLIAKKYGVSLDDLIAANPQIADPDRIDVKMQINIPAKSNVYVVQKGDTMWLIAKKHGVSLEDLIAANPQIADPNRIDVNTMINLPGGVKEKSYPAAAGYPGPQMAGGPVAGATGGTAAKSASSEWPDHLKNLVYLVKAGDTLYKIAKNFGVPLQKLIAANPQIADPDKVSVYQKVFVPVAKEEMEKATGYQETEQAHNYPAVEQFPVSPSTQQPNNYPAMEQPDQAYLGAQNTWPAGPCPCVTQLMNMMDAMNNAMNTIQQMQQMQQMMMSNASMGMESYPPCYSPNSPVHAADLPCLGEKPAVQGMAVQGMTTQAAQGSSKKCGDHSKK